MHVRESNTVKCVLCNEIHIASNYEDYDNIYSHNLSYRIAGVSRNRSRGQGYRNEQWGGSHSVRPNVTPQHYLDHVF